MMRWVLWDAVKDGEPPRYAMHTHNSVYFILQQLDKHGLWVDVPLFTGDLR